MTTLKEMIKEKLEVCEKATGPSAPIELTRTLQAMIELVDGLERVREKLNDADGDFNKYPIELEIDDAIESATRKMKGE